MNSSVAHSEIVAGKWASKMDRIRWGLLLSHTNGNPVDTEVDLIVRVSSECV